LKATFIGTESLQRKISDAAEQAGKRGAPGQINDFGDPAFGRQRF
jgi:hypothetical protein